MHPVRVQAQKAILYDWRDGLTGNSVKGLTKDREGYLWLGTARGIMRFDGYRFLNFNEENTDSTRSFRSSVTVMYTDKKNRIWVGNGRGAAYYSKTKERFYYLPVSGFPVKTHIRGFCEDAGGTVYLCGDDGFFVYDESSDSIRPLFSKTGPVKVDFELNWRSIAFDPDRKGIWLGTSNKGLMFWDLMHRRLRSAGEMFPELDSRILKVPISLVVNDYTGNLWYAHSRTAELYRLNLQRGTLTRFRTDGASYYDHYLLSLSGNAHTRLWFAGRGYGIFYLESGDSVVRKFSKDYGVAYVTCRDNLGNIWFGTSKGLVCINAHEDKITRYGMEFLDRDYEFPRLSAQLDPGGNILLSSSNKGFFKYRFQEGRFENIPIHPRRSASNNIQYFGVLGSRVYAATWNNVYLYEGNGQYKPIYPPNSEAFRLAENMVVLQVMPLSRQRWLMIVKDKGIFVVSAEGKILYATRSHKLPFTDFVAALAMEDGGLLAGTGLGGGLVWLDKNFNVKKVWRMQGRKDAVKPFSFERFYKDRNGWIWLCSYGGVQLLNPLTGQIENLKGPGKPEGLCVVSGEDRKYIYLVTPFRIVRVDKQTLRVNGNIHCKNVGASGYMGSGVLLGSKIWLVADHELLKIDTAYFNVRYTRVPFRISALKIFGLYRYKCLQSNRLDLKYNENHFTLDFTDLNYNESVTRTFRFRLSGFENLWNTTAKPTVSYTNIPPGHYTLLLKVLNDNGKLNEYRFPIAITPPWWQTFWAKTASALLGIATLLLLVNWFTRRKLNKQKVQLEKVNLLQQERLRIASELHDDMGSELTSIRLMSEVAQKKLQEGKDEVSGDLGFISETASLMVDRMNQIVWALNPENDQSQSLITYIRQYLYRYFEKNGIPCTIKIPEPIPSIPVSAEKRQQFFLAVKEIAHNVVKHAHARSVDGAFELDGSLLVFTVKDDGALVVHYDELMENGGGNGLKNLTRRMKALGGNFSMRYEQGSIAVISMRVE